MVTVYPFLSSQSSPPSSQPPPPPPPTSSPQQSQPSPQSQPSQSSHPTPPSPSSQPSSQVPSSSPNATEELLSEESPSAGVTPSAPPPINYYSFLSPGPNAKAKSTSRHRDLSWENSFPFKKDIALPEVRNWVWQCRHCGQFGHSFLTHCPLRKLPRVAEHHRDWRVVHLDERLGCTNFYSVLALYPSLAGYQHVQPNSDKLIAAVPTGSISQPAVSNGPSPDRVVPSQSTSYMDVSTPQYQVPSPSTSFMVELMDEASMLECCSCHSCSCPCHTK